MLALALLIGTFLPGRSLRPQVALIFRSGDHMSAGDRQPRDRARHAVTTGQISHLGSTTVDRICRSFQPGPDAQLFRHLDADGRERRPAVRDLLRYQQY
jgi:hypothetical protein